MILLGDYLLKEFSRVLPRMATMAANCDHQIDEHWVDFHFLFLPHVPLRGKQTGAQSLRLGIQLTEKPRKLTPEEVFAEIDQMPLGSVEISRVHAMEMPRMSFL